MASNLIILGNGFDLRCGLNSSFEDFYERKQKQIVERFISDPNIEFLNNISLFSLLLYNAFYRENYYYPEGWVYYKKSYCNYFNYKDSIENWMDVEQFLSALLTKDAENKLPHIFNNSFHNIDRSAKHIVKNDKIYDYIKLSKNNAEYRLASNFFEYFFIDLKKFEKMFNDYLIEETKTNDLYKRNVTSLMTVFINRYPNSQILNFNYTTSRYNMSFSEINIHGKINEIVNDVIVGIDSNNIDNLYISKFTKTYRKLISSDNDINLLSNYFNIVIYGHSLGEQDYSYFQSIFDFANLYDSKASIIFYYSDYYLERFYKDKKLAYEKNILRDKQIGRLYKLLKTYGNSLDNKEKGKNLIHKLLLENRIKIILDNFEGQIETI